MGTLGRRLLEGEDKVRIHGQIRQVAARIERINGFSAHADKNELMRWLSSIKEKPRQVFVTHGEESAAHSFAETLKSEMGLNASVPAYKDSVVLD